MSKHLKHIPTQAEKTIKTGKAHVLTSAVCIKIMNQQQRKKKQEGNEKEESRKKIAKDELAQKKKKNVFSNKGNDKKFPSESRRKLHSGRLLSCC